MGFLISTGLSIYQITQKGIKVWGGKTNTTPDLRFDVADANHPDPHIHIGNSEKVNIGSKMGDFLLGVLPYVKNKYNKSDYLQEITKKYEELPYKLTSKYEFLIVDNFTKYSKLEKKLLE